MLFQNTSRLVRPFVVWFLAVHGAATIAADTIRPFALPGEFAFFIGAAVGLLATVLFWGMINEIVELVTESKKSGD